MTKKCPGKRVIFHFFFLVDLSRQKDAKRSFIYFSFSTPSSMWNVIFLSSVNDIVGLHRFQNKFIKDSAYAYSWDLRTVIWHLIHISPFYTPATARQRPFSAISITDIQNTLEIPIFTVMCWKEGGGFQIYRLHSSDEW